MTMRTSRSTCPFPSSRAPAAITIRLLCAAACEEMNDSRTKTPRLVTMPRMLFRENTIVVPPIFLRSTAPGARPARRAVNPRTVAVDRNQALQCRNSMSSISDDLTGMKDDMTAFIEGLGMRRFFGYVECDEIPSVLWDSGKNPDSWKDFVELAKSTAAPFLTMHSWALEREELDGLSQRLADGEFSNEEDLEESRWLKTYIGKTGFVQLGWAYQGCLFVYEAGTEWYAHYQHLRELADDAGGFMIDEPDGDEER